MAIKRVLPIGYRGGGPGGGAQNFTGISSDQKPLPADISKNPNGSRLHFVDTGERFIYHDGMWEDDLSLIYAFNTSL